MDLKKNASNQRTRIANIKDAYEKFLSTKELYDCRLQEISDQVEQMDESARMLISEHIFEDDNGFTCDSRGLIETYPENNGNMRSLDRLTEIIIAALG